MELCHIAYWRTKEKPLLALRGEGFSFVVAYRTRVSAISGNWLCMGMIDGDGETEALHPAKININNKEAKKILFGPI